MVSPVILNSVSQLHGAEAFVRRFPQRLFLDHKCTIPLPLGFEPEKLKVHLVAVTSNSEKPAQAYFLDVAKTAGMADAVEGSGSLFCDFSLLPEEIEDHPFRVTDLDPGRTFVRVFDEACLDMVLAELDTRGDFLHYLDTKVDAVRAKLLGIAPGEEELLAMYSINLTADGYGDLFPPELRRQVVGSGAALPGGMWKLFRNSEEYAERTALRRNSRSWDRLLAKFSLSILDANTDEADHYPLEMHEKALSRMASENRMSRIILASQVEPMIGTTLIRHRRARVLLSPFRSELIYVFLALPYFHRG